MPACIRPGSSGHGKRPDQIKSRFMSAKLVGFAAALHTPRREDGSIDFAALARNTDWVISQGASGVVPCGGTGGFSALTLAQRKEIVEQLAWVP
ncbi:MAG: hypothetical protein F4X77_17660, partial [Acidobacteriia bacterium]|nr:hypothetical protein [Terriglobia bacterium]